MTRDSFEIGGLTVSRVSFKLHSIPTLISCVSRFFKRFIGELKVMNEGIYEVNGNPFRKPIFQ